VRPPQTIPEALFATAEGDRGEYVFHLEEGLVRLSCAELAERALQAAGRLATVGVGPGDAVGVLGPNRPEWVVWAFATWIAGAALVPVQIPLRVRDPGSFREQLRRLVEVAACRCVVADPRLAGLLPAEIVLSWEDTGEGIGEEPSVPQPQSPAVIQFTSGSTAAPKGAVLPHAAVAAQMGFLRRSYCRKDGTPRAILSWTPFFHDLGLFGNLVQPAFSGATVHQLPTERFAKDPAQWLRLVEETRVAVTVGPSAAFGSALRAAGRRGERVDLSSLDAAFFAAEGVDPEVARRMMETAREFGFRPEALGGTYGLAEAVMAVAFPYIGTGLQIDRVSLEDLVASSVAAPATEGSLRLVASCGPPLMDLRIHGAGGTLPERHVGEIQVRGPSLMSGYVGAGTRDPFVDGWLQTGDLGYLADGDLYVTGREKDIVITTGHNYYPEDFEWAAARVDGVRPGRCVAFSLPDTEEVVVLVEARDGGSSSSLAREVSRSIANAVGIAPSDVLVLPAGTVEKTTSGKLRRATMREAYSSGALATAGA
jgi:acyl-CoA synthetase (AMP-forming)/AMP-acid ligase II